MDDIEGRPQVSGQRLGTEPAEVWRVVLEPEGLRMFGPEREVTVALGLVHAVRHRAGRNVDGTPKEGEEPAIFEVEWITALGEDRRLTLATDDSQQAERLARVVADNLSEMDRESRRSRRDWVLVTLLALSVVFAVVQLLDTPVPENAYDWTAVITNFVVAVAVLPGLYLLVRTLVRSVRRRSG